MSCCGPERPSEASAASCCSTLAWDARAGRVEPAQARAGMVLLPGGSFVMGSNAGEGFRSDGEGPAHEVELLPFWIDATATTNRAFSSFADDTGYRTVAERLGSSFVFGGLLPDDFPPTRAVCGAPWWREVEGADFRHPEGPQSSIDDRLDHPVVHVSWEDARAYAAWCGKRLPTEAEWEYAARGGLVQARFPWGDELTPSGEHRCNIWQGRFPGQNNAEDGFVGTAPAAFYLPNGFGLHQMAGNVWEWCADWFGPDYYQHSPRHAPRGPETGHERVIRGGSYLCHASYCSRYRVAARSRNTPASTTGHLGFRCAAAPA